MPPPPANVLTYTANVSECARTAGAPIDPGDIFTINFEARTRDGGNAGQNTSFRLRP